ncbi:DUF503 domain-containing protein [soil metagenome]
MWAAALRIRVRILDTRSLKRKRSVLRPHIERLKAMMSVSVAEVDQHDAWQRATLGVALVAADRRTLESLMDRATRYFDSQSDIELIDVAVSYLENPE